MVTANEVLQFWFEELTPEQWFKKDDTLDDKIKERFSATLLAVARGETYEWRTTIAGRLAEIIVLDQFSRNIYRGQAESFAFDGQALILAQEALKDSQLDQLTTPQRSFLYMPFMHSESPMMHKIARELFTEPGMENNLEFEEKHWAIIEKFGRYPHRNQILGRSSTPAEIAFLQEPNSSF